VRPNRDEAIIATLSDKLKLTAKQTEKFREGMAAARRSREQRNAAPRDTGDGANETSTEVSARRGALARPTSSSAPERQGRISQVLEGILMPEQMTAFKALRDEWRDSTSPANVWTQTPGGLRPHRLLLGLSDDSFSEVLRGELRQGDRVVTRARQDGGDESDRRGRRGR
jgi:hypothetical protein